MLIAIVNDPHYGFTGRHSRKIHEQFSTLVATKINEFAIQALIVAGDIASSKQKEIEAYFKLYRSKITIPILCVFGNHDYWDVSGQHVFGSKFIQRPANQLFRVHDEICRKFEIHYLGNSDFVIGDVRFCGYDGWYRDVNIKTNDLEHMTSTIESVPTHLYMNHRAYRDCDRVLNTAKTCLEKKLVCISHFDSVATEGEEPHYGGDPKHLDDISKLFDLVIYGHSHKRRDVKINRAKVVSPGGGYDDPILLIYDLSVDRIHSIHKLPWTKRLPNDTQE